MAAGSLLVVATDVVQASNDKQQVTPMLAKLDALPEELGAIETLLADTGYFSEANVQACVAAEIDPLIAMDASHTIRRSPSASPRPRHRRTTNAGRGDGASAEDTQGPGVYGLRKHTPEPVFGIIKSALGFRQFLLRGLDNSAANGTS